MKTKDAMSGNKGLRDNLVFKSTPDITQAKKALRKVNFAIWPPFGFLTGWTIGTDADNSHVHVFLSWHTITTSLNQEEQEEFYELLKKEFNGAGFEIVTEETIGGNEYFHVGFASRHYELEKIK